MGSVIMREHLINTYYNSDTFLQLSNEFNAKFKEIISNKRRDVAWWAISDFIVVKHRIHSGVFIITVDGKGTTKYMTSQAAFDRLRGLISKRDIQRNKRYEKVTELRTITKLKGLVNLLNTGESLSKASKLMNLDYTTAKMFKNGELGITEVDLR